MNGAENSGPTFLIDIILVLPILTWGALAIWQLRMTLAEQPSSRRALLVARHSGIAAGSLLLGLSFFLGTEGSPGWLWGVAIFTIGAGLFFQLLALFAPRPKNAALPPPTRPDVPPHATGASPIDDPGWTAALELLAGTFLLYGLFLRRRREQDPLTQLRVIFLTIPVALVMFLFAFSFIAEWDGGEETFAPVLLLVAAVGSHTAIGWGRKRPLDTSTSGRLAGSYRTSMFTGVALAESVALISLAAVIITGSLWLYMIGLVSALLGLLRVAPGARDIARRQLEILSSGSSLSLLAALRTHH